MDCLAEHLDSTLLAADATATAMESLAREAIRLGCAAVCVNPVHVGRTARVLSGTPVRVASVAGFPLGATPVAAKIAECRFAMNEGASELDVVAPIWAAVSGEAAAFEDEVAAVLEATRGATRKVIVEIGLLDAAALELAADILNRLRPEFAKTGTGYARPVSREDVAALRRLLDPRIAIKAAGGVRTREQAESLIESGATRIGTSRAAAILGR
jgi:deoxyribose-phosphate aldolase